MLERRGQMVYRMPLQWLSGVTNFGRIWRKGPGKASLVGVHSAPSVA